MGSRYSLDMIMENDWDGVVEIPKSHELELVCCIVLFVVTLRKKTECARVKCDGDCKEDGSEEDGESEDDGSSVIESIRNIGTAGVVGIIVGAAAIVVIVPILYCFLCGWLCFDKERSTRSKIKSIKEASKNLEKGVQNPNFISQMESDKIRMDDYLRKLSISQLPSQLLETGTRQNSFMSFVSSRRNSGVTNASGIVTDAEEATKHFTHQPLEFAHAYSVLFHDSQKLN